DRPVLGSPVEIPARGSALAHARCTARDSRPEREPMRYLHYPFEPFLASDPMRVRSILSSCVFGVSGSLPDLRQPAEIGVRRRPGRFMNLRFRTSLRVHAQRLDPNHPFL